MPPARQDGVAVVELALALPALALVIWLVAVGAVAGLDHLVVQRAANVAARTVAVTADPDAAHAAATRAAGPRPLAVEVRPGRPSPGDLVEVEVASPRTVGPLQWRSVARGVARVEPQP